MRAMGIVPGTCSASELLGDLVEVVAWQLGKRGASLL